VETINESEGEFQMIKESDIKVRTVQTFYYMPMLLFNTKRYAIKFTGTWRVLKSADLGWQTIKYNKGKTLIVDTGTEIIGEFHLDGLFKSSKEAHKSQLNKALKIQKNLSGVIKYLKDKS
jgi:hypothetical protein